MVSKGSTVTFDNLILTGVIGRHYFRVSYDNACEDTEDLYDRV
jgi:hypothetical protein